MEEAGTVDKVDQLRRGGLYLGPVILGSMAGNGFYGAACGGQRFVMGVSADPLVLRVAFVIGGVILACRMKEPIGRVALLVFAVHQGILAYASVSGVGLNLVAMTTLFTAFAVMVTASGARDGPTHRFVIAGGAFVAMFVFSMSARYYADVLLDNHSVLSSGLVC